MFLPLLLAAALVVAAEPEDPKELVQQGQSLYRQRKYSEALAKFEAALSRKPHPALQFNIARCHEALGQTAGALGAYREYLRLLPDAVDRAQIVASVDSLERALAKTGVQQLAVIATPHFATLEIDGRALGNPPAYVELPPGAHVLIARAEGYEPVEKVVGLPLDHAISVELSLRPVGVTPPVGAAPVLVPPMVSAGPPPPMPALVSDVPPAPKAGRKWTWAAAALTGVAAGTATGLGLAANGASAELRGAPHTRANADLLAGRASGLATGANVAWVTTGIAGVAAVVLFFVEAQ